MQQKRSAELCFKLNYTIPTTEEYQALIKALSSERDKPMQKGMLDE